MCDCAKGNRRRLEDLMEGSGRKVEGRNGVHFVERNEGKRGGGGLTITRVTGVVGRKSERCTAVYLFMERYLYTYAT